MPADTESALHVVPFRITNPELIPAARYYDQEFFEAEKRHLWPRVWQMACRLEEIPEPGDYTVYTILDHSVLMLHTKDGVRGFRNACRHRGVRLANGPGHCGSEGITCPYHGWKWNSDGENIFVFGKQIFTPEIIEKAEIDLVPMRTEYWAGCAFINFDDEAPSLRDSLGSVAERLDARLADKLRVDWWVAVEIPCNWKLAVEAFQESYHVMQTHPQVWKSTPNTTLHYGPKDDGQPVNEGQTGADLLNQLIDFHSTIGEGMGGGIYHPTETELLAKMRDLPVPGEPAKVREAFYGSAVAAIEQDIRQRGAETFDVAGALSTHVAVDFMFPNFFLLPGFAAMASYRMRPLTAESCLMEVWCLAPRGEGDTRESPTEPTFTTYNSTEVPLIPAQDYANLPLQQLGAHDIEFMRLGKGTSPIDGEGMISNYQRVIDGFLAGLDHETLRKAQNVANSGFQANILDVGF